MTLGYSKPYAIVMLVIGALLAILGVATGDTLQILPGVILAVLGVLLIVNPVAEVDQNELRLKSPIGLTMKRFPISGPADLRVEGKRVIHVPTGKKTASLGFGIDPAQAARWRQWIDGAPTA